MKYILNCQKNPHIIKTLCNESRPHLNEYILQFINNNLNIDFTRYDNWHKTNGNWNWGGDGEAEMIIIQFRKIPPNFENTYWNDNGIGGMANLFGNPLAYIDLDGVRITDNDGITATQGINRTTRLELVLEHEISHHIFADMFSHQGFKSGHVSIGLMTQTSSNSTYCMLPMERTMTGLNWMIPMEPEYGVQSQEFTLRDELEYGDAVKVKVPGTNPIEYLYITNHQKKSIYDGVSRGSNNCFNINHYEQDPYCPEGKGLYIFHESNKFDPNNVNGDAGIGDRHYAFDLKSATGKWNWTFDTTVYDPINLNGNFEIQKITSSNPLFGINTYYKAYLRKDPNWVWSALQ